MSDFTEASEIMADIRANSPDLRAAEAALRRRSGTYRIVRFYEKDYDSEVIARGLTLDEAQAHCNDPETSSSSATSPEAVERTEKMGRWFHGYEKEQ